MEPNMSNYLPAPATAGTPSCSSHMPSPFTNPTSTSPSSTISRPIRRREKIQLSCTLCRSKKLKCDRNQPCRSCIGRGLSSSCTYPLPSRHNPPNKHPSQKAPSASGIQNKISQLEGLVVELMGTLNAKKTAGEEQRGDIVDVALDMGNSGPGHYESRSEKRREGEERRDLPLEDTFGRISLENKEVKYVDRTHWTAILDGISELKDHFEDKDITKLLQDPTADIETNDECCVDGPELLFGCHQHATKEEIISSFLPRPITDRLISKFFVSMDMASVVVHTPTFLREYERFWVNPQATPVMFLGLLFAMMCLAVQFQQTSQTPSISTCMLSPALTEGPEDLLHTFRSKTVQCLILGRYNKGAPYTIQTLLLYFAIEHFHSQDTQSGPWILLGVIIRVAMRAGYHRDPSHYQKITPFSGEMRRRAWAMLVQVDLGTSQQVGLPRMIRAEQYDTLEPHNLLDSDFDESVSVLPKERPDTELTPMMYIVYKNRILAVHSVIADLNSSTSTKLVPYTETMRLDGQLHEARRSMPKGLQPLPMKNLILEAPHIILRRIYLDMIYQTARCQLHRRYLVMAHTDPHFKYSRESCIEAALKLLQSQKTLNDEIQDGGRFFEDKWKVSSLLTHEFLTGMTILALDLNLDLASATANFQNTSGGERANVDGIGKENEERREMIIEALKGSYEIWLQTSKGSRDAEKAAEVLRIVLGKVERFNSLRSTRASFQISTPSHSSSNTKSPLEKGVSSETSTLVSSTISTPLDTHYAFEYPEHGFGWEIWDNHPQFQDQEHETDDLLMEYDFGGFQDMFLM